MNKIKFIILVPVISFLLYILWLFYFPVKFAVDIKKTEWDKGIFLCKVNASTGGKWRVFLSNNEVIDVNLLKNDPSYDVLNNYFFVDNGNYFIIYGKEVGIINQEGENIIQIEVERWDIVKPFYHFTKDEPFFIFPKNYLRRVDFKNWF